MSITIRRRPVSGLPHLAYLNFRYLVGYTAEWAGDHRYRIDTRTSLRGYESLATLSTIGDKAGANPYVPTPFRTVRRMLSYLPQDVSDYTFVDYGSGRGRVILLASERKFREVIGVEFSHDLHQIAERNIRRFHGKRNSPVNSLLLRAEKFLIPEGPCVLYLSNPFDASIMKEVVGQVTCSYQANPRHIIVLYYNQTVWNAFEREEIFRHTRTIREDFLGSLLHLNRYTVRVLETVHDRAVDKERETLHSK
jgi:hypothetical protein